MEKENNNYENIGPTARGTAYRRTLSDIKYVKEIFDALESLEKLTNPVEIEYLENVKKSKLVPQFEARYKLTNRILAENKNNQVLEIAAGLSPRGLIMTEENPLLRYVELDLPAMAQRKRKILRTLFEQHKAEPRNNLHVEDGDALDNDSLLAAARHFRREPVSILNEGLLRYLGFDQKTTVAKNVRSLLEKFGGVWITPDITFKKIAAFQQEREDSRKRVMAISGINVEKNAFENADAARKFFNDLGFAVEQRDFLEIRDELSSPKKLGLSDEETGEMLKSFVVFVMRINPVRSSHG